MVTKLLMTAMLLSFSSLASAAPRCAYYTCQWDCNGAGGTSGGRTNQEAYGNAQDRIREHGCGGDNQPYNCGCRYVNGARGGATGSPQMFESSPGAAQ